MKRSFAVVLIGAAALVLFVALVHSVLVLARVSEPASTTVNGLTARRAWATASAGLAFAGVIVGVLARARSVATEKSVRRAALIASGAGLIGALSGLVNVTTAGGGPGTGNGVVGGAAALVLGLVAVVLGALVLTKNHRARSAVERTNARY